MNMTTSLPDAMDGSIHPDMQDLSQPNCTRAGNQPNNTSTSTPNNNAISCDDQHHKPTTATATTIVGESTTTADVGPYSVKVTVSAPPMFDQKNNRGKKAHKCFKNHVDPKLNAPLQQKRAKFLSSNHTPIPNLLEGPSHLLASVTPGAFPKDLTFRALSVYSTIRTLSIILRISPFTPNAFLRALSLPIHSTLLGEIHASILKLLFAYYELGVYHNRGDGLSKLKLPSRRQDDGIADYIARKKTLFPNAGENLLYLNHLTWPLYLLDYAENVEADPESELNSTLLEGDRIEDVLVSKEIANLKTPEMNHHFMYSSSPGAYMFVQTPINASFSTTGAISNVTSVGNYVTPLNDMDIKDNSQQMDHNSDQAFSSLSGPHEQNGSNDTVVINELINKKRKNALQDGFINDQCFEATTKRQRVHEAIDRFLSEQPDLSKVENSNSFKDNSVTIDKEDDCGEVREDVRIYEDSLKRDILKPLRSTPYATLSTENKLNILEYIIDELVDTAFVKHQIDSRHNISFQQSHLYGKLPNSQQLANLVNEDECLVCEMEGDLICCDGCTSSYHRDCVNIPLSRVMSADKWFCHECNLADSSKFGTLYGGSKCSIDWFTLNEIEQINIFNPKTAFCTQMFAGVEFLIIGGFVFARHTNTKGKVDIVSIIRNSGIQCQIESSFSSVSNDNNEPIQPLAQTELYYLLIVLGPSICSQWPWSQIPFHADKLHHEWTKYCRYDEFDTEYQTLLQQSKQRYNAFMYRDDSFNPLVYTNSYNKAPLPIILLNRTSKTKITTQGKVLNIDLASIRGDLSRDVSRDNELVDLLTHGLYDPLEPIRDYMINLEKQLFKSTLLHDLWGLRSKSRDVDWWVKRVKTSRSIKTLGKLLVRLIDDTYSRAFVDEWNLLPGINNDDVSLSQQENRTYIDTSDWSEEEEIKKRKLLRCGKNDVLKLLGHLSSRNKLKRKREITRKPDDKSINTLDHDKIAISSHDSSTQSQSQSHNQNNEGKSRRKSDRHHAVINPSTSTSYELIKDKIVTLEAQCKDFIDIESHWPIAGRKLFEPEGSIPQGTTKWLGRNAGIRRIPYVTYSNFEIGLPSVGYIWRQNTLKAVFFEQLLYQIQFLDSYLNKSVSIFFSQNITIFIYKNLHQL